MMKRFDVVLLGTVVVLLLFGLLTIYNASSYIAFRDFGDKYHYIKDQSIWMILGTVALFVTAFFDYHKLYNLAVPILLISMILLIVVFVPHFGVYALGAHRWINTGFFILQPAEFIKLVLAIYLAAWFSSKEKGRLPAFSLLMGVVLGLIMLEPDMGTAGVILFEAITIYFLSGGKVGHFVTILPILGILGFLFAKLEPYRAARISAFFNTSSLENTSYHVKQILIALGSGGITGVGLGNSLQKYAYLPENTTDSIFAIIAEELGFIGATILILLLLVVVWRGFMIAAHAKDTFGKLLAGGVISFLAIQMIINLGAQTALIPLTGIPLPFISYGGSALVIDLAAIGILLNISRQMS